MDDFGGSIEQRDRQIKSLRAENEKLKKLLNKDGVNAEYKDRLFKFIFGHPDNKQWTLELYNAVNGTDYKDTDELQFNTIGEALYLRMKNDISFIIYFEMNLWERQSTFNPNMPMRFLRYAASLYEKFIATTDYYEYSSTLQKIPTPKCVCFYNGTQDQPEKQVLSLSDAYEGKGDIEVNVTMLNINYGKNRKLMEACAPLKEYAWLVDAVRRHQGERMDLDAAVDASVDEMPGDFVIHEFIIANRAEVKSMLLTEYNEEKVMEKERQEGQKEVASLMSFLASNGRSDDIVKAGQDENFLNKLLSDFRGGMMAAE
ncbi:MAG: hypothetical protein J5966_08085 [Lachnospiraceae bacterium]|nr:hypothetical protein [Lachnospiraceae bacterium]